MEYVPSTAVVVLPEPPMVSDASLATTQMPAAALGTAVSVTVPEMVPAASSAASMPGMSTSAPTTTGVSELAE
jgi:hypothetical protein